MYTSPYRVNRLCSFVPVGRAAPVRRAPRAALSFLFLMLSVYALNTMPVTKIENNPRSNKYNRRNSSLALQYLIYIKVGYNLALS